ncbi:MAG: hypothetical protein AB4040_17335, partial [Synechococcus sp.]
MSQPPVSSSGECNRYRFVLHIEIEGVVKPSMVHITRSTARLTASVLSALSTYKSQHQNAASLT